MRPKADFGIDAPSVVRNLAVCGVLCLFASGFSFHFYSFNNIFRSLALIGLFFGACLLVTSLLLILSSRFGKLILRERLLDSLQMKGDEYVLDVGCGRGLYLIGAAKRLTTGKAIGLDIWNSTDLSGNIKDNTILNAKAEGVTDRVEIKDGDARNIPFTDNSFDLVLSSFAIHNISEQAERQTAFQEIVRVMKPGAKLCVVDFKNGNEYRDILTRLEIGITHMFITRLLFPFSTVIIGEKK
jgi:arsenite methyltransferase